MCTLNIVGIAYGTISPRFHHADDVACGIAIYSPRRPSW
jgi:hypothetical protein